ncbi:hypothetical protein ON010_g10206 [Phytophthora cinnamomi]|nr:hypothetical protein ON010_g10206 [Phytophthora cinnamomi]
MGSRQVALFMIIGSRGALMPACHGSSWTIARKTEDAPRAMPWRTRRWAIDWDRLAEGGTLRDDVCMESSLLQAQKHATDLTSHFNENAGLDGSQGSKQQASRPLVAVAVGSTKSIRRLVPCCDAAWLPAVDREFNAAIILSDRFSRKNASKQSKQHSDRRDSCRYYSSLHRIASRGRRVNSAPRRAAAPSGRPPQRLHQDTTEFNGSEAGGAQARPSTFESEMEKLLTKIGAPSYLPTPAEVLDGVRWLRENPAIAAGVVVGLTSYSVAKYYEYGEDSDEEENAEENDENTDHHQDNAARATPEEIARSVTALHLGLLNIDTAKNDRRDSAADSSASTASSLASSGGLRSRASSVFDKAFHEPQQLQSEATREAGRHDVLPHRAAAQDDARSCQGNGALVRGQAQLGRHREDGADQQEPLRQRRTWPPNGDSVKNAGLIRGWLGAQVGRPLGAALATFLDSGVAFNTSSEFLFFDGEDDDGT